MVDSPRLIGSTVTVGRGRLFATLVLVLTGALMLAGGVWALAVPGSFAEFAEFPYSRHFLHDAGAFQIGIGVTLLLAAAWADAAAVALAGFSSPIPSTPSTQSSISTWAGTAGTHGRWGCSPCSLLLLW
jgi:hypothetical protein